MGTTYSGHEVDMTMVVGVFESLVNAHDAVADLLASGYSRNNISVLVRKGVSDTNGEEDRRAHVRDRRLSSTFAGFAGAPGNPLAGVLSIEPDDTEHGLADTLEVAGLEPSAARFFADAICNGAILVAVHCAEPRARDARDILAVYNDSDGGPPPAKRGTRM